MSLGVTKDEQETLLALLGKADLLAETGNGTVFESTILRVAALVAATLVVIGFGSAAWRRIEDATAGPPSLEQLGVKLTASRFLPFSTETDYNGNPDTRSAAYFGDALLVPQSSPPELPGMCIDWGPWLDSEGTELGATSAGTTKIRLLVQSDGSSSSVVLTNIMVDVQKRDTPPSDLLLVVCSVRPDAGPGIQPRKIVIDLDNPGVPPYLVESEERPVSPFAMNVTPAEAVELWLVARTETCDCSWSATLQFVIDGEIRNAPVQLTGEGSGDLFRTTASTRQSPIIFWTDGRYSATPEFMGGEGDDWMNWYDPDGMSRYAVGFLD